ncbi:MAG: phenylalanine--tRNA ligase subunit alpha [Candidatus Bipolaricaulia bacterium]
MVQIEGLKQRVQALAEEGQRRLEGAASPEDCEAVRVAFLGRKGRITELFQLLPQLPQEARPEAGRLINALKEQFQAELERRLSELKAREIERKLQKEAIDVTLPGRPVALGKLHPSTQVLREIYRIFSGMGFQVFESPEIETDEYNFQLLNIPPDHPARDMWSTFYLTEPGLLLRTHTSPGQLHVMRRFAPEPIRAILPGKCYRYEQVTARSEMMFHQVEGLAVGRQITMADLKGVLTEFAHQMFGKERRFRFRASYFPFTEPSLEMDMDCILCGGKGCRVCKHTGWVEILGAGMVHPQVLRNGGYDPEKFTGFAFGMGPERILMLKYNIDDIRLFFGNDLRFLEQF